MKKHLVIAIDGPAGAGKSTVSKAVAKALGIHCLDTGALFRAFAHHILEQGKSTKSEEEVLSAIEDIELEIQIGSDGQHTLINGKDVTQMIRTPEVSQGASDIGVIPEVRRVLTEKVRRIANNMSLVVDGRDVGTAMLPNADYKFYLTADVGERAKRRQLDLQAQGKDEPYEKVLSEMIARDKTDSTRKIAPLCKAEDAIVIDSSHTDAQGVIKNMIELIQGEK